jgi:hypothetical protein
MKLEPYLTPHIQRNQLKMDRGFNTNSGIGKPLEERMGKSE